MAPSGERTYNPRAKSGAIVEAWVRIFLSGQTSCDNRGSAAIVESTIRLFLAADPATRFAMPSWIPAEDRADLPADLHDVVEFVPLPRGTRAFNYLRRLRPGSSWFLRSDLVGRILPAEIRAAIEEADAVLSVGGDLYSGDYGFPVVVYAQDAHALARGKPVFLWSASLGRYPQGSQALLVPHLERFERLFLRDSLSYAFAERTLPEGRLERSLDPAFTLPPSGFAFDGPERFDLGINLSRLAFAAKGVHEAATQQRIFEHIVESFVAASGLATPEILLLPHVFRRDSGSGDDHAFLEELRRAYRGPARLVTAPNGRKAGEYKWLVSRCATIIAARTHVTIAAFSQMVPTLSIAYSLKARGLNLDIFGHERFCHSAETLLDADLTGAFGETFRERATLIEAMRTYRTDRLPWLHAAVDRVRMPRERAADAV